jgi:hypothetical protein
MRTLSVLLSLGLLLPAAGCRDAVVDPLPDDVAEEAPPPSGSQIPTFYLKGPTTIDAYSSGRYRSEINPAAARYEWSIVGDAAASLPDDRITEISMRAPGTVELRVFHFDAEDELIGLARKSVTVTD